jgi:hypothetical protein
MYLAPKVWGRPLQIFKITKHFMKTKFKIGDVVAKKKPSAGLELPNKKGTVVDFVTKTNKNGIKSLFYVVQCDNTGKREEWAPGITFLSSDETASRVAFARH